MLHNQNKNSTSFNQIIFLDSSFYQKYPLIINKLKDPHQHKHIKICSQPHQNSKPNQKSKPN